MALNQDRFGVDFKSKIMRTFLPAQIIFTWMSTQAQNTPLKQQALSNGDFAQIPETKAGGFVL